MAFFYRLLCSKPHFNHCNSLIAKLDSTTPLTNEQKIQNALSLLQGKNNNPAEQLLYLALSDAVSNFPHNPSTPNSIPSFLHELKTRPSLMCSLLDELKSRPEFQKDKFFCNFITLYRQAGMFGMALQTFRDMPKNGISHSTESINVLLHNALLHRGPESYGFLDEFSNFATTFVVRRHVVTCNLVLKLYIRWGCNNMRGRILDLLCRMKMHGCYPDDTTDSIILAGLYKETLEKTVEVLDLIENCKLSVKLYNHWIATLCNLGRTSEAKGLVEKMLSRGIMPNADTYQHLFRAYGEVGDVIEMQRIFNDMSEKGVKCDRYCFETLVEFLCRSRDFETALQACKSCISMHWFPSIFFSDLSTMKKLVDGLVISSQHEELETFVDMMEKCGLRPGRHIYNFTVESLCGEMKIDEAMRVFKKMMLRGIKPNADTYKHLIRAFAKDGNVGEVTGLFEGMSDIGVVPDVDTCLEVIKAEMGSMWRDMKGGFIATEAMQTKIRDLYHELEGHPNCVNIALCLLSFGTCYRLGLLLS